MQITRPDFYSDFKCTASRCSDSCCIGWNIYIDEFTEEIYNSVESEFGEKLRENISFDEDGDAMFAMKNRRCPFLNKSNLCDIFINLGENYLCDICTEHPRFYNVHGNLREEGLGLACEEACRLLLTHEGEVNLVYDEDDEEPYDDEDISELISERNSLLSLISEKSLSLDEKIAKLLALKQIKMLSNDKILEIYKSMESMEDAYLEMLNKVNLDFHADLSAYESDFEKVLSYMIYRYYTEENDEGELNLGENLKFAVSFTEITKMCYLAKLRENDILTLKDRIDIIKCLSKNVEYSDENRFLIK